MIYVGFCYLLVRVIFFDNFMFNGGIYSSQPLVHTLCTYFCLMWLFKPRGWNISFALSWADGCTYGMNSIWSEIGNLHKNLSFVLSYTLCEIQKWGHVTCTRKQLAIIMPLIYFFNLQQDNALCLVFSYYLWLIFYPYMVAAIWERSCFHYDFAISTVNAWDFARCFGFLRAVGGHDLTTWASVIGEILYTTL